MHGKIVTPLPFPKKKILCLTVRITQWQQLPAFQDFPHRLQVREINVVEIATMAKLHGPTEPMTVGSALLCTGLLYHLSYQAACELTSRIAVQTILLSQLRESLHSEPVVKIYDFHILQCLTVNNCRVCIATYHRF